MKHFFQVKNYSLERTLLSGQAFRWNKLGSKYVGVVGNSVVKVEGTPAGLSVDVIEGEISRDLLSHYLAIDEDYEKVLAEISEDINVKKTLEDFSGYRILRQEPYEMLISFIDSANNSIRNIRGQIEKMSKLWGEEIGDSYYSFPRPEVLAGLTEKEIMKAGVGFRGKYIISAAKCVADSNFLDSLNDLESQAAHEELTGLYGVGDKIADCVLLFAYNRLERVPIDVWTKRIFGQIYGIDCSTKYSEQQSCAQGIHKKYAGYAFSFLFEAARAGNLLGGSPEENF
ncbi:hypothetical protein JW710_01495 [Candidatus Dojkabacteria bacterium]|nr:hypothetical protein [Candidatus Dojkabacteria bacterium]